MASALTAAKFPIFKSELRELSKDSALFQKQVEERIEEQVNKACSKILEAAESGKMYLTYGQKEGLTTRAYLTRNLYSTNGSVLGRSTDYTLSRDIVQDIIARLKLRFPDSLIFADPLNTYIHIDWN